MSANANVLSEEEVRSRISSVLIKENLEDAKLQATSGSQKGDGYGSLITRVNLSGKRKELNLILKWAHKNEELRKSMPISTAFDREIYFYDQIWPAFQKFQQERNVIPIKSAPKCFSTISEEPNETIVMEDIVSQGFRLWDRKLLMDDAHIVHTLKEYGKFHAISFAMKDQNAELYNKLADGVAVELFQNLEGPLKEEFRRCIEYAKSLVDDSCKERIQKALDELKNTKFWEFIDGLSESSKYCAISHGDCWSNNMMFKYENDSSVPTEMRIIDFQLVRSNSPAVDLAYLIYSGAEEKVYNNLEEYLRIYYASLEQHMNALGSDAKKMFPFEALMKDWETYYLYGFVFSLLVHKVKLIDDEDRLDTTDMADGKDLSDILRSSAKNEHLLNERLTNVLKHVVERGYLK